MPRRLARVVLLVALLAGWQAALEHPIQHGSHEASLLCDLLDALGVCAAAPPFSRLTGTFPQRTGDHS